MNADAGAIYIFSTWKENYTLVTATQSFSNCGTWKEVSELQYMLYIAINYMLYTVCL